MTSTQIRWRIRAPRATVYRLLLDANAIPEWRVPEGMTCRVHTFEPIEGGSFRVSLTYDEPTAPGKTTEHTDTYRGRFVQLVENERVVETVEFETSDPALRGVMTITTILEDAGGATELRASHEGLPPGVSPVDNEAGWRMAIEKLATLAEAQAAVRDGVPRTTPPATIGRSVFDDAYDDRPPWDIDGPQRPFRELAGKLHGSLLDAGCGSGEHALFFASKGLSVTGIDFVDRPILLAREKAARRGLSVRFLVKDALTLESWDEQFDNAIDSGLLHVFSDLDRATYLRGLGTVVKPGGYFCLLCFSDHTPGDQGPRRISRRELEECFSRGWQIDSLALADFVVRPEARRQFFGDRDPVGWYLVARREA